MAKKKAAVEDPNKLGGFEVTPDPLIAGDAPPLVIGGEPTLPEKSLTPADLEILNKTHSPARSDLAEPTTAPKMTDPGWHDFVMSHFTKDELVTDPNKPGKFNPRVNGLWRVTELLIGPIVGRSTRIARCDAQNAAIEVVISIHPHGWTGQSHDYSGAADATPYNLTPEFMKFPVTMAETRATGRALRTALRLYQAVAAEEMVRNPARHFEEEEEVLTSAQLNGLDTIASRCNFEVRKFIMWVVERERVDWKKYGKITRLPREFGMILMKTATEIQRNALVPDKDLGKYDSAWKDNGSSNSNSY